MTALFSRLLALRRQRGLHLAAIVDGGAAGARAEWHKEQAARLSLEIERLEEEIRVEEARKDE